MKNLKQISCRNVKKKKEKKRNTAKDALKYQVDEKEIHCNFHMF